MKIEGYEVHCGLFTDQDVTKDLKLFYLCNHVFHTSHKPWPLITLLRYHDFVKYEKELSSYDYIFYIDADMEVVGEIGPELIEAKLTVVQHPGQFSWPAHACTYERNPRSACCVDGGRYYCIGAFQGGTKEEFFKLSYWCKEAIDKDLKQNYIPIWHDESALNKYLTLGLSGSTIYLSPSHCYPQGWLLPFEPKIMALSKDQQEIRNDSK